MPDTILARRTHITELKARKIEVAAALRGIRTRREIPMAVVSGRVECNDIDFIGRVTV